MVFPPQEIPCFFLTPSTVTWTSRFGEPINITQATSVLFHQGHRGTRQGWTIPDAGGNSDTCQAFRSVPSLLAICTDHNKEMLFRMVSKPSWLVSPEFLMVPGAQILPPWPLPCQSSEFSGLMSAANRAMFGLGMVTCIPQQQVNLRRRQGTARNEAFLVLTCYFGKRV